MLLPRDQRRSLLSFLIHGFKINDARIFQTPVKVVRTESDVCRVRQVGIAILGVGEGYDEAMGEAQIEVFRT